MLTSICMDHLEFLKKIGRKGGKAKVPKGAATLTPEERAQRGRDAAAARWGKKPAKKGKAAK